MGLRYVLVEGDFLVGCTGVILPVGRSSPALTGIPVAFIGDMVQCFICGDVKPIEKDGGPYRIGIFSGEVDISVFDVVHATEEFAYEHDVIYCKCGKKPLEALLARVKQAKDSEDVPVAYMKGATEGALALGWDMVKGTLLYASDATNGALNTLTGGALEKYAPGTFSESIKRNQANGQAIMDAPGNALDATRRALNRRESLAEQGYNAVSNWWDRDVASHNATDPRLAAYNATRGGLTAATAVAPVTRLGRLGAVAEVGDASVATARARQAAMLEEGVGYNISPTSWDNYPTIGRNGTFVTDQQAISEGLGQLNIGGETRISASQAAQLERDMGLQPGSLSEGFKVRQIDGLGEKMPRSPLEGNEYFQGPGQHLPSGAPEMVIDSIPTIDGPGVKSLTTVIVE